MKVINYWKPGQRNNQQKKIPSGAVSPGSHVMYMYTDEMNKAQAKKRFRTGSDEIKPSKKYRETKEDLEEYLSEDTDTISDISDNSDIEDETVAMAKHNQPGESKIDLNILKTPEGIQELLTIFQPLLDGIEKRLVTRIDTLEENFEDNKTSTQGKLLELETRLNNVDRIDQQTRQNNLIFCGIPELDKENTDVIITNLVKDKFPEIQLKQEDIQRSFRLKMDNNNSKKTPKPILVKFTNYSTKKKIYLAKKQLRNDTDKLYINEDLIPLKSSLFAKTRELRNEGYIWKTWTFDSIIYYTYKEEDDKPKTITSQADIDTIREKIKPMKREISKPSTSGAT